MRRKWLWIAPFGVVAFIGLGGLAVMQLWNWLLPGLFGWPHLTFWQALGLLALCRILFGGIGSGGHFPRSPMRGMTPEEREKFRQGLRARCAGTEGAQPV
jgi:hypothetical protein